MDKVKNKNAASRLTNKEGPHQDHQASRRVRAGAHWPNKKTTIIVVVACARNAK
jgi:hypothetical protein